MSKVIELYPEEDNCFFATCPECRGTEWNIVVDSVGLGWRFIKGTQCANEDCNCFIKWVRAEKEEMHEQGDVLFTTC